MDIDRLLQVHQSVNLATIREQNKYMLGVQAEQCGQIMQLRKQIDASNSVTRQILENQLKAIQHQENLKYYKKLVYNVNEATNIIANTEDKVFKFFLNTLFHDIFQLHIQEAKENLEEISDKMFCSEVERVLEANNEQTSAIKDKFSKSAFQVLLDSEKDYNEQHIQLRRKKRKLLVLEKEHLNEKSKIEKPDPIDKYVSYMILLGICSFVAIWIPGGFIFLLFALIMLPLLIKKNKKWKKNYPVYLEDFKQKEALKDANSPYLNAKKECDALEVQLSAHPYIKAKYDLSLEYPVGEKTLEKITSCLPISKEAQRKNIKPAPNLYNAAKWAVTTQKEICTSVIERKFAFNFNQACRIINQLEDLGIIKGKKALFNDVELLDDYWEDLGLPFK